MTDLAAWLVDEVREDPVLVARHKPFTYTDPDGTTQDYCASCSVSREAYPCRTLRLLAVPHADRPGYEEEWKP